MSKNTFIKWWFSWASAMELNFIQPCFGCGENIKILAADATKIGITLKQSNVVPIETRPDNSHPLKTLTRRFDRTLINNDNAKANRKGINDIIRALVNHVLETKKLALHDVATFLGEIQNFDEVIVTTVNSMFTQHCKEAKLVARVLAVLTEETSIVNTIPEKYKISLQQAVNLMEETNIITDSCQLWKFTDEFSMNSRYFFPELGEWLQVSIRLSKDSSPKEYAKNFLKLLISLRGKIQSKDVAPEEINCIKNYNPPRDGQAYYFNPTGRQLREVRTYSIDLEKKGKINFDDEPEDSCSKMFPTVTKKGTTYLFLWFCPVHGHCWGFHIIPSAEGRKDAANSLYCYLEKAPETIFYDFSCSLEEYCRNRESGYFTNTRFFHDIFHGYSHKCSTTFKSNRLLGYCGVNTSICEQFNSFLQCIKASCKLMTQEHFTFYVQFFIFQWNAARKRSFTRKASIAIAGYE